MKKLLFLLLVSSIIHAETIELVGYGVAGGQADQIQRAIQKVLVEEYQLDVILVYKPGADGKIATNYINQNAKRGNIIGLATTSTVLENRDFNKHTIIGPLVSNKYALVVSNKLHISSFNEFVNLSRTTKLNCGTNTLFQRVILTQILKNNNIQNVEIVNYKSQNEEMLNISNGDLDCSLGSLTIWEIPHKSNRLKIIGILSDKKISYAPSAILFKNTIDSFKVYAWFGIAIPPEFKYKSTVVPALNSLYKNDEFKKAIGITSESLTIDIPDPEFNLTLQQNYSAYEKLKYD